MDTAVSRHTPGLKKPRWLIRSLPTKAEYEQIRSMISEGDLHTVCQEAACPNQFECFSRKTATFLIMGHHCTRNCRFCNIDHDPPETPDPEEPVRVARVAAKMKLKYVVVTSVTRDDLSDGGARFFADTIREIRKAIPDGRVEVLIPDFQGDKDALQTVINAHPDVLNHNIETVPRLYPIVRPQAIYQRSLNLMRRTRIYAPGIPVKSGMMLGIGENDSEIRQTLGDLYEHGCRYLTIGQYLQPSRGHLPVDRYVSPEQFDAWRKEALNIGFKAVAAAPFVRSSYHAEDMYACRKSENDQIEPHQACASS